MPLAASFQVAIEEVHEFVFQYRRLLVMRQCGQVGRVVFQHKLRRHKPHACRGHSRSRPQLDPLQHEVQKWGVHAQMLACLN
jgi:hypothetical protein